MNTFGKRASAMLVLALALGWGGAAAQRAQAAEKVKKSGKKAAKQAAQEMTAQKPAGAESEEKPVGEIILENEALKVCLGPAFPRALRYEWKKAGAAFDGAADRGPGIVEINGTPYRAAQDWPLEDDHGYRLTTSFAPDSAAYTFHVWQSDGALSFALVFRLEDDALKMRLQDVAETGNFRLRSLYFPNHQLLSLAAGTANASACRVEFSRSPKGIIKIDRTFKGPIQGLQPDAEQILQVGYLMRTTAVYGNGKFGIADRFRIADRPELAGPFQAEMLAVYLVRLFTLDLVEHVAHRRAPDTAVQLDQRFRRFLGIGNATGLGMAPFLMTHPLLIAN
ncbi:MAG: hypothetical protein NTW86_24070, partial [Candidatus Sumerlaeota bacterium]|nr:hypothetical protein [Candidatus Sumerlaeota bacterium]